MGVFIERRTVEGWWEVGALGLGLEVRLFLQYQMERFNEKIRNYPRRIMKVGGLELKR